MKSPVHVSEVSSKVWYRSYVCFPAGQALAHYIHNTGRDTFAYLMIGERIADDEVTYPADAT